MLPTRVINLGLLALKSESPIERQILDYLTKNPAAQDTLRGIVEWWLMKENISQTTADVEAALAKLVAEGKLSAWKAADRSVHYGHHRKNAKKRSANN
jgi:hypothetical protein